MSWKQIFLDMRGVKLFCNFFISNKDAKNIIITHTPVITTCDISKIYEPLEKYNVNIFAFDFRGTGKSDGREADFSRRSIVEDLDFVVNYIKANYSEQVYIYGSTGIGGIFAQYYVSKRNNIKGFAQFACLPYRNTKGLGYPLWLVKCTCFLLKRLPNFKITMKPPKYIGFNAAKDNEFYDKMYKLHPDFLKCASKMMLTLLEIGTAKEISRNRIEVPVLVFKTLHDRYFSREHFDEYYNQLTCPKKMIEINNVHNSYYLYSDLFCKEVYKWFCNIDDKEI